MNWSDDREGPPPLAPGWCDAWLQLHLRDPGYTYDVRNNPMMYSTRTPPLRLDRCAEVATALLPALALPHSADGADWARPRQPNTVQLGGGVPCEMYLLLGGRVANSSAACRIFAKLSDFKLGSMAIVGKQPLVGRVYMDTYKGYTTPRPVLPSDHFGLLLTLDAL